MMRKTQFYLYLTLFALMAGAVCGQHPEESYLYKMDLDAITVSAKKGKRYKRAGKREKEDIVERFKQKLVEEFPDVETRYDIESEYILYQDTIIMANGKMEGQLREIPLQSKRKRDSLSIEKREVDEYINSEIERNLEQLEEGRKILKNREEFSMEIFKLFWGVKPSHLLQMIEPLKGRWDYIPNTDQSAYITFRGNKGFMGIFKIEWKVNFLVNKSDLSLLELKESVEAKISIPFGIEVDSETLENINQFNVAYGSYDRFKFRRGWVDFKRSVSYRDKKEEPSGREEGATDDGEKSAVQPIRTPSLKSTMIKFDVEGKDGKEKERIRMEALSDIRIK